MTLQDLLKWDQCDRESKYYQNWVIKLKERIWHDTFLEKEKAEKDTVIVDILDQF